MKFSTCLLAVVAQVASAHYFFDTNIINGVAQPSFRYVRASTRPTRYNPIKFSSNPAADIRDNSYIDGPDARCNQGAGVPGSTQVLAVTAGSEVRLRLGVGASMQHPGPSLVYMSRAPTGNVLQYDGSGDWFKIFQEGVCNSAGDFTSDAWCSYNRNYVAATIPRNTPNGEYLVRFEHIGVHRSHVNQPEHYVSCLQVRVTGGGTGTPGPLARFPGAYRSTDAYANFSIYNGHRAFTFPGPAVWNGASSAAASQPAPAASQAAPAPAPAPVTTTRAATQPTSNPSPSCAALYGQCGGTGFTGAKCCAQGTCKVTNQWYSQCL